MKVNWTYTLLLVCCLSSVLLGQTPSAFSYEGIATDPFGSAIADREIAVLIEIATESVGSLNPRFTEKHQVMTSPTGKFSLAIGRGERISGGNLIDAFQVSETRFLTISIDVNGREDFVLLGSLELMSVPYAYQAHMALNETGGIGITGPAGPFGEHGDPGPQRLDCCLGVQTKGDKGATGPQGPIGPQGLAGLSGLETLRLQSSLPELPMNGQIYLDDGSHREDNAPGFRYYDVDKWIDL